MIGRPHFTRQAIGGLRDGEWGGWILWQGQEVQFDLADFPNHHQAQERDHNPGDRARGLLHAEA